MPNSETAARSRLAAMAARATEPHPEDSTSDAGAHESAPPWLRSRPREGEEPLDEDEQPRARSGLSLVPDRWRDARLAVGRGSAFLLIGLGVLAAVFAGFTVWQSSPQVLDVPTLPLAQDAVPEPTGAGAAAERTTGGASDAAPPPTSREAEPPRTIVVSVVGLVAQPGLVTLPEGARIADALAAVAGALPEADVISLNMAQRLADGDQVLVGLAPREGDPQQLRSAVVGDGQSPGTGAPPQAGGGPVNLNTATAAELDALPGVGPVTAAAIIAWRDQHGSFSSIEQLASVKGIGPAKLASMRDLVTV
jgi:competence protein ComEA